MSISKETQAGKQPTVEERRNRYRYFLSLNILAVEPGGVVVEEEVSDVWAVIIILIDFLI
jgi:hypothetical protein